MGSGHACSRGFAVRLIFFSFFFLFLLASNAARAVVGGIPSSIESVPGQVALIDLARSNEGCATSEVFCKQFCSGVLIAPDWVLTAAHCAAAPTVANLRVLAGTADLFNATLSQTLEVKAKYVHPFYGTGATFDSDIALIQLTEPVLYSRASLVDANAFSRLQATAATQNDEVQVSGWGRLSNTGGFPKVLQRVALDLQPDSLCQSIYNQFAEPNYIAVNMLCVLESNGGEIEADDAADLTPEDPDGEGVCNYDSGGPLFFEDKGSLLLVGLVSFDSQGDCGSTYTPSVFTRVLPFIPWIEETTRRAGSNFGDLALSWSGDSIVAPGATASFQVKIANASQLPSGSSVTPATIIGAGIEIQASSGDLSIVSLPSDVTCTPLTSGYRCVLASDLSQGGSRTIGFAINPASSSLQQSTVVATSFHYDEVSAPLLDYRPINNSLKQRVLFSNAPDIVLELSGYTREPIAGTNDGYVWVLGHLNNNGAVAAHGVQLSLALPEGYSIDAWEADADSCGSGVTFCVVGDLAVGEEKFFRLRLRSAQAVNGEVILSASSSNGDFPAVINGEPDVIKSISVVFEAVSTPIPPVSDVEGSPEGGSLGVIDLILLFVFWIGAMLHQHPGIAARCLMPWRTWY